VSNNQSTALGFRPQVVCAISVSDLKKSIAWYQEKLGFKLLYTMEEIAWSELETPVKGTTLGLSQVENPEVKGAVLTWEVEDVDHARGMLETAGVKFAGDTNIIPDMVKLATFYDPDGNTYMLSQTLSGMQPQ
jgi:catechol 2,3-dioxygenase-like lactoylglutathione lyase family enzyme